MLTRVIVLALALLAGLSVLYATPWGVGTGFDQSTYIGAARNLLAGRGLSIPWGEASGQPVTQFPPLYPLVLAALGKFGLDPWSVARYLNVTLRAFDLLLTAGLAWRIKPVPVSPILAAFLLCCSVQMEFVFGSAWSEPLFLAFTLISLWLLSRYLVRRSASALLGSALVAGAAGLTRYVGLGLLLSGVVVLLWRLDTPLRARIQSAAIFATIGLMPLAAWFGRNAAVAPSLAGGRTASLHVVTVEHLTAGLFTLLDWVMPSTIAARLVTPEGILSPVGAALCGAATLTIGYGVWRVRHQILHPKVTPGAELSLTIATFAVAYTGCVIISIFLFDNLTQLDSRILSPVYLSLVTLISAFAGSAVTRVWLDRRRVRPVFATLSAVFIGGYVLRYGSLVQRAHSEGVMYSNVAWLTSPTMHAVAQLPQNARVFSNAPDAIYMLAYRNVYEIPYTTHADDFLVELNSRLHQTSAPILLVYFDDPNIAYRQPVLPQVVRTGLVVQTINRYADGTMYEVSL